MIPFLLLLAATIKLDAPAGVFRVSGRGELSVYVGESGVPVLGSSREEGAELVFRPRFPLAPGLRYRAVFRPAGGAPVEAVFDIPKRETPAASVERVYPSAGRLPENLLKFYIHFSAPMSRGEAYKRVRLLDASGAPISLPFLELDEELWDREGKRLMILFDPGRVKRGLLPREEAGVPIEDGKSYTLVIDREWLDAGGRPLKEGFRKPFVVGPADREPPDPKNWRVTAPAAATLQPLTVEFPEPLDRALVERLLEVADLKGNAVAGSVEVDREETRWRFTPRSAWKAGEYSLLAGTVLEDLAGNTIGRPFEVDVFERVQERISRETVAVRFRVK